MAILLGQGSYAPSAVDVCVAWIKLIKLKSLFRMYATVYIIIYDYQGNWDRSNITSALYWSLTILVTHSVSHETRRDEIDLISVSSRFSSC